MTGVLAALDRVTVKFALAVPELPSDTDTSAIDTLGGVATGGVAVPTGTPLTVMFVGVDPGAPGLAW